MPRFASAIGGFTQGLQVGATIGDIIQENRQQRLENELRDQSFKIAKQAQEQLNQLVAPQEKKAKDRAAGLDFLNQLNSLAGLPPKERKPQIEQLSKEAEQVTGKPFAENALKTLSTTDSERLNELLTPAIDGAKNNPDFGLQRMMGALTDPGQFMATVTDLNKRASRKEAPGTEQTVTDQKQFFNLERSFQKLQDQLALEQKREAIMVEALMQIPDEDLRKSFGAGLKGIRQRKQDIQGRLKQLEARAFGEPIKLGPGDVVAAGGAPGQRRGIIASSPVEPRAETQINLDQTREGALTTSIGEGEGERRQKLFAEALKKASTASGTLNRIRRTKQLLEGVNVGPNAEFRQKASKVAKVLGVDSETLGRLGIGDAGSAEGLKSILAQTTLDIALEVPGAISDGDLGIAREITGDLSTSKEGFNFILDTRKKIAKQQQKFGRALTEFRKGNPNLEGIDQFVLDFQQDNPLFTDKEIQKGKELSVETGVDKPKGDLRSISDEELQRLLTNNG